MKKTIICSIPMNDNPSLLKYEDSYLPASDQPYRYAINSYLEQKAKEGDEYKVILLMKQYEDDNSMQNKEYFINELDEVCNKCKATAEYVCIDTPYSNGMETPIYIMEQLVEEIVVGSVILVDVTFGPKELPITIFSALRFAEKFLRCEIDHIIYGYIKFVNGKKTDACITDMMGLFYLDSLTEMINCDEPDKAKEMLRSLVNVRGYECEL